MATEPAAAGAHCRICGSQRLNKFHFALDLSRKISLYQVLGQDKSVDELIRPCECRGDFAFAHRVCLADWIETTKHEFCDICRFRYSVKYIERSIFDWMDETQQIKAILKVFVAALLVYYLSALGVLTHRIVHERNIFDLAVYSTSCIWAVGCSFVVAFYCYCMVHKFNGWKFQSRRVIVDANNNPQLDSQPRGKDVLRVSGFSPRT